MLLCPPSVLTNLCRVPVPAKDPIVCIANSLYTSDEVASQRPAPKADAVDDGGFEEDGAGAEGPEVIDLTAADGQSPQVNLPSLVSHAHRTLLTQERCDT